ncbi:MAG: NAD(P)H-dependent oxidoreductase [Burkholderiales bacterium]|nr:NAD(P)H-dependent oxidoreductase [Burkholderiales bacterium]
MRRPLAISTTINYAPLASLCAVEVASGGSAVYPVAPVKILILSCSLNPRSKSHALALRAAELFEAAGAETCVVELGALELPICGSPGCFDHPQAAQLTARVREADGVLLASPIYNYDVNAACKNAIELTGEGWEEKVVGFLLTAGGQSSYMSVMSLANSLMLDFRCVIVPRFVYATGAAFRDGVLADPEIARRVEQLCAELLRMAAALRG